mmetsp:Transcript_5054/g.13469  ORF Transcript_5054/g.13469 Transcript_5054/m.13469 type:complete len:173 (-) Transcript_5054:1302-1820(-)
MAQQNVWEYQNYNSLCGDTTSSTSITLPWMHHVSFARATSLHRDRMHTTLREQRKNSMLLSSQTTTFILAIASSDEVCLCADSTRVQFHLEPCLRMLQTFDEPTGVQNRFDGRRSEEMQAVQLPPSIDLLHRPEFANTSISRVRHLLTHACDPIIREVVNVVIKDDVVIVRL